MISYITASLCFVCSLLALVYAIRSITSRHTSGERAGNTLGIRARLWIGALFGAPESWTYSKDDPIYFYKELKKLDNSKKKVAHRQFFFSTYHTYDEESLLNLRLFELRASNYSKSYTESLASWLTLIALAFAVVWLLEIAIPFGTLWNYVLHSLQSAPLKRLLLTYYHLL